LGFLLFAELQAVANNLGLAIFTVLSRSEIALLDGTLIGKTFCPFEEQLHALAAAQTTYRTFITCQFSSPLFWIGLRAWRPFFPINFHCAIRNQVIRTRHTALNKFSDYSIFNYPIAILFAFSVAGTRCVG